jgi:two-component system sensor histidine kinase/response regulator
LTIYLIFQKIEVGKIDFTYSNTELRFLLEDLISSFSYQAKIKNNDLFYLVESNVPPFVYIDSTRIRQVLSNLLSNAIKFTADGQIFIRLSLLKQEEKNNQISLLFEIHDNGPGIEESIKKVLFEPFAHKDPILNTHRGSGLGLAISRRILNLMGGKIWIDLNQKKGTCFNVEISSKVTNKNQVGELSLLHPSLKTKKGLIISEKDTLLGSALYQFLDELKMVPQIEEAKNVLNNKIKQKDIDVIFLVLGNKSNQEEKILLMLRDQYNFNQIPTIVFSPNSVKKNMNDDNKKYLSQNRQLLKDHLVKNLLYFFADQTEMINPNKISLKKSKINPIKVLVVDDNVINHYVVSKLLSKIGVKIISCYEGSEAIAKIKKENFDIIFVDIHMPNMNGFTLSERIINLTKHKKIPLIYAMTADITKQTRYKSRKAGMIDVIAKPLTLEKIKIIFDEFVKTQKNDLLNTKTDSNYILLDEEFLDEYELDILKDLFILFNKEAPKNIKLLSIDQTDINFSQISEIAHKFKGTALTIGALYLAELCGELQKVCQKKQSVAMSKKIAQIINYYKKTKDQLKTYIEFREKLMGMAND